MKVGIITQARMTSTRLPQKVLLPLGHQSVLAHHIERLEQSGCPVFVATTTNATDNPIIDFCIKNNLPFYRGSEEHVLSRFYHCAVEHGLELIVRVTSDCPLIDGNLIKESIEAYFEKNDPSLYLSNCIERTFPRGFDFEVFSFELLEEAYQNATLKVDIEHVTPFIHQQRAKKVTFHHIVHTENKQDYRITLDTIDDYQLLKVLIENFNAHQMGYQSIIDVLDENPQLNQMNRHIEQKKLGE